jgi:hypothetical protein
MMVMVMVTYPSCSSSADTACLMLVLLLATGVRSRIHSICKYDIFFEGEFIVFSKTRVSPATTGAEYAPIWVAFWG